jgi:hypothetical protein
MLLNPVEVGILAPSARPIVTKLRRTAANAMRSTISLARSCAGLGVGPNCNFSELS